MRIIDLKIVPYSPTKAYVHALVDGDINYSLQSAVVGKEYELTIQEVKKKRTMTANAYYQVLLDKLANALRANRDEVHAEIIRRYGATKEIEGHPVVFTLRSDINANLVSKYVDAIMTQEKDDKQFTVYRVLKGSSEMDSKEFAHLLDGMISECKELDIETLPPDEIARLKYE